ncbi:MAG: Zn-dependent exopeptidase M28 [Crocinitomicaceae bacterium]|nr:Zn-dependent exopeptidase M28 [Crocinitomicaceae bacterium]
MKSITLLLFCFIASQCMGQLEKERAIMKTLCSPAFDGRGYVRDGMNKAAHFIGEEFQKTGALAAGNNDSYFQKVTYQVNTFPGIIELSSKKRAFEPGVHYLVESYSGSYNGDLKLKSIDIFKLINKDTKELQKLEKLKGNMAILLDLTPYHSRDTVGLFHQISSELAQFRPVVLITNEKFMWSVGRSQKKYPVVLVQDSVFNNVKSIHLNVENKFLSKFETKNVVAKIPGESSDSCFVFTAHFDHLGRMGTEVYFPGANDNASGTTMLISLADYYSKNKPKFDIYFIAFCGEEAGLVGSKEFVDHPTFDIQRIKFLLNLDIMGSGDEGITAVNGTIYKNEFEKLKDLSEAKSLLSVVKPRGKTQNSDHFFFQEKGIKTFFIYTMGKNKAYHDVFDKYETLDMGKFEDLKTLLIDFVNVYP